MTRVITVEREFGSEGAEFAAALADRLGWQLADKSLVDAVARAAGIPPTEVEATDERLDPWYHRLSKGFWQGGEQSIAPNLDSDAMLGHLQTAIRSTADRGNSVIVGRAASSLLCGVPGCFHIFTYASMPRKKRWFEETFPDRARHAEQQIHAADAARAAYVRQHYNRDWADRHLYHLMLNSCMGIPAMVDATIRAAALNP